MEMLAVLAITSLIGLVVAMANMQIMNQSSDNSNFNAGSRNTLNALHWISRDIQMAQSVNGTDGFPQTENLVLSWQAWDNTIYSANYTVVNGELTRTYTINGSNPVVNVVAEYINTAEDKTYCSVTEGVVILTITSTVGEGSKAVDVTKVHEITSRPNL
jgi:hypothetical protein